MGNFSRDPKARLTDSIAKHYVGVRMQQAVPVVDADWNELEDLRRREQETFGFWFIGNGVPSGNDGYRIISATQPNDFGIVQGVCLVNGKLVENSVTVRYTTQPNFGNPQLEVPIPVLTNPGASKQFIAYLDVWEREVDSEEDPVLVDARIGIETTLRLKREWAVRVARMPEDLAIIQNPPPGHIFYPLARLNRQNNNQITTDMIEDLRDTQVSVLRRVEVRNNNGAVVVDNDRFQTMLTTTRNNVHNFIKYLLSQFLPLTTHMQAAELLGMQAGEHIASTAEIGLSLLGSGNLANRGALNILSQLYYAENNFMVVWRDFVLQLGGSPKTYASFSTLITRLSDRLNLPLVGPAPGLRAAVQAANLEAATNMQEEIARLFGASSTAVPRGSILIFLAQSPLGNLTSGTARFVFKARSFTTLADTYTVRVLPDAGWPRRLVDGAGVPIPGNKISIGASNSPEVSILIDVDVQAASTGLQLRVTSDANPEEINQLSTLFTLTQGQPAPPGEDKVQLRPDFSAPVTGTGVFDEHTGTLSIVPLTQGKLRFRVFNNTGADNVAFNLTIAKQNELGTWEPPAKAIKFDLGTPPVMTPPINNGQSLPFIVTIQPGDDAVSLTLLIMATATINSIDTRGQLTLSLVTRPS